MDKAELTEIFDKYCKKLRIVPAVSYTHLTLPTT